MNRPPVTLSTRLFYGFGAVAYGVKDNGFLYLLLLFYNQVLGLPDRQVGFALMIALLVDAVLDPLIGGFSDRLRSPWGRRHPLMYAACLPVAIGYYFVWNPPQGLSGDGLFLYLLIGAVVVRALVSTFEIPAASLVAELSENYDERTSLLSYRYFFQWWGGLTVAVIAYAVFLQPSETYPIGILNRDGYGHYGLMAAILIFVAMLVASLGTHSRIPYLQPPPEARPRDWGRSVREFRETIANKSFLALLSASLMWGLASGLTTSLNSYINVYFWELSPSEISIVTMAGYVAAVIALVLSLTLARRFGKRDAAIVVTLAAVILGQAPMALRLLGWFPDNHAPALLPILFGGTAVVIALAVMSMTLITSMVADVVDDSEMKTGRRSEGVFFAANLFVLKSVSGIGVFASTLVLTVAGFPQGAKPGSVDPAVLDRLALIYLPTVTGIYLLSIFFMSRYRITRASHAATLQSLKLRRSGALGSRQPPLAAP